MASHMYRMAMMAFLFDDGGIDSSVDRVRCVDTRIQSGQSLYCHGLYRCIKLALVHDLAESLVGDLVPNEVTKDEKYKREKVIE